MERLALGMVRRHLATLKQHAPLLLAQAFPFTPLTTLPKIPGGDLAGIVKQSGPGSQFKPMSAACGKLATFSGQLLQKQPALVPSLR